MDEQSKTEFYIAKPREACSVPSAFAHSFNDFHDAETM